MEKNSLFQHGYTSSLLPLKAKAQYFLETFRKEFRFEETLKNVLKQHRQQDQKIAIHLYKRKTK